MVVAAKIIAWNNSAADGGCGDFSLNTYWGDNYKNVFYLCGDLGRSTFKDTIENTTDKFGLEVRTQDTSVEVFVLSVIVISPLLSFLHTISKHDNKQILFIDTGHIYNITNITIDDQGDKLDPIQLVNITFEDEAISKINGGNSILNSQKLAFFDNDNNGVKNLDGEAQFTAATTKVFNTWQLYYESNGVTPATSGNVIMSVYAVSQTGIESLVGVFRGVFNDLFSDSTKWQSSQQIWNYFAIADKVGHTQRVQFDKRAFAEDNGYFSDEIEDRAVDIRYELSINGSPKEPTTLSLVYSVAGAFSSSGVQVFLTGQYGITTVGKIDEKNTLSTIQDIRTPLAGGSSVLISSTVLLATTNFSNQYTLDIAPPLEFSYQGSFTTPKGYISSNFRGAYGSDNYTLGINDASAIKQSENILNFTLGASPYIIVFDWKYDRQSGGGGFPALGASAGAGSSKAYLNGVVLNSLAGIAGLVLQALGTQTVTLPDTQVNVILLDSPTTTGYNIFTEFEVKLKPLY